MSDAPPEHLRREPRQARSKKLVGWILHGAARVFEERGYAGATTNHIAERAGVSIGSLYRYFPDKDAILTALALRHLEEGEALAADLLGRARDPSLPLAELLRLCLESFVGLHESNPGLHRLLFEEAPLPARVRRRYRALLTGIADEVAGALQARAEVAVRDPRLAAYLLVQTFESLAHGLVIHPPAEIERPAAVAGAVEMLCAYLRGGPAAP